ncbi:MAG: hypothetical protein AAGG75_16295 [Bacteroidota bacterium]
MHPYKVNFLETSFLKPKGFNRVHGKIDGLTTSKELEAMIIEEDKLGYELHSITPMTGNNRPDLDGRMLLTSCLMITFKRKD